VFCGVSSISTRDAEGPGDCGSGVFIAVEIGVGDKGSGNTTMVDAETLLEVYGTILASSTAKVSGFTEYQLLN
jgi:hypothetical protein